MLRAMISLPRIEPELSVPEFSPQTYRKSAKGPLDQRNERGRDRRPRTGPTTRVPPGQFRSGARLSQIARQYNRTTVLVLSCGLDRASATRRDNIAHLRRTWQGSISRARNPVVGWRGK